MICDQENCRQPATVHFVRVSRRVPTEERNVCREHASVVLKDYRARETDACEIPRGFQGFQDFVEFDVQFMIRDKNLPQTEGRDGWVYLREVGGHRFIAFETGVCELAALRSSLTRSPHERPIAHTLMASIIATLGAKLEAVSIDSFSESSRVFYASLRIRNGAHSVLVGARPSDAATLAILCDVPLVANRGILARADGPIG